MKENSSKGEEREGHEKRSVSWRQRYTMSLVYYRAEVVNYPDSYFLSPLPPRHPTPTVLPPR